MKKVLVLIMGVLLLAVTACGKKGTEGTAQEATQKKAKIKVGVVLGLGGLGDKSFNDSAFEGLKKAKEDMGIEYKLIEPTNLSEYDQFIGQFVEANYDLIIGVGFDSQKGIEKAAKENPNKHFLIIDSIVDLPNVKSVIFNQKEGAYIAGALSALTSKTGKLGYIAALEIPQLNEYRDGYKAGALSVNSKVEVKSIYIGGNNPFNDPAKAKELAMSLKANGCDVLFAAAGGSGRGVIETIKNNKDIYGIGIDANQDGEVKGRILTSVLKRVDTAVLNGITEEAQGKFVTGKIVLGVKEEGIEITDMSLAKETIGKENIAKVNAIVEKIKSGKLVIK